MKEKKDYLCKLRENMINGLMTIEEIEKSMHYLLRTSKISTEDLKSLYNVCDNSFKYNRLIDSLIYKTMKNIFLIPTQEESNLTKIWSDIEKTKYTLKLGAEVNDSFKEYQFIYITNDEKIVLNDSVYDKHRNVVLQAVDKDNVDFFNLTPSRYKKIVLSNDSSIDVQQVSSSFLTFFAENEPEYVEVVSEIKAFDKDGFCVSSAIYSTDYTKLIYYINFPQKQ